MEAKRIEVAVLIRAGHSKDKPKSGKPTKLTPEAVMKAFKAKPDMPMSMMAKKKGVSTSTVSRMVKSAGGKSLRKVQRLLLSKGHQEVRVQRCGRLLNDLKHHGNWAIFFSDKKTFMVDPVFNKQNDRIICFSKDQASIRNVTKTKHPASVMMLGVVASTGDKMAPIWFPSGYRLTAADYLEVLSTKQDGAPAHTANKVQVWMAENMKFWPKDFWPPQSPDLNPLDFSIWWHVESKACRTRHNNIKDLKNSVNQYWKTMRKSYVINVCKSFRRRLENVLEANGGHIHK
ncbi:uncharacterized protein LOC131878096 [Tigriopus californicus]|uniref:uncharacterized protein LOC131878096 n=1 Tax=Tigriopus californicus TaxID=6832 RepID=UPI0027D9CFCE|nr:uncharacterized protein LOC131878096 [Tigriopus californicus]